jgi:hypothetical protein
VNPNQMDSNAVLAVCSWVLGELLRYAQKGSIDISMAEEFVASISQKRFPHVEEVEGRVYFLLKGLSARDVALLTLMHVHPARVTRSDLVAAIRRHGSSQANAMMGIARLERVADDDGQGNLRLLRPGLIEAEQLLTTKSKGSGT